MSLSLRIPSLHPIQEIVRLQPNTTTDVNNNDDDADDSVVATTSQRKSSVSNRCNICSIRPSQYTCPRCHIPYCSLTCYQKHGVKSSLSSNNDASTIVDYCTETFYEHRVTQLLQLEVKEQTQQFQQQIKYCTDTSTSSDSQFHKHLTSSNIRRRDVNCDHRDTLNAATNGTVVASIPLNREELVQVWSILEQIEDRKNSYDSENDDDDDDILQQKLQQHCSIRMQKQVQQAMENLTKGRNFSNCENTSTISHINDDVAEWIVEPWSPWWSSCFEPFGHYGTGEFEMQVDDDDDDDNNNNNSCSHGPCPINISSISSTSVLKDDLTLDERLLVVPRFETLYRAKDFLDGENSSQRLPQFPQLQYNLVDIVFATIYILRTFHGIKNIEKDMSLDAAMTLINSSLVLQKDQRYTSVESVLLGCYNVNHPIYKQIQFYDRNGNDKNMSGSDKIFHLLHDVVLIFQNHRYVARALLEAGDIIQQAITEMKQISNKTTNAKRKTKKEVNNGADRNMVRNQLRRIHKKITFYLSWTMAVSNIKTSAIQRGWPYFHISTDIQIWIEGWQIPSKEKASPIKIHV